jgi:carboxyl-terminal processing protease
MTARTRLAILLLSTPLVAFVLVGGYLGKASAREESYQHLRVFEDVVSLVVKNYVEPVDVDKVMDGAMRGLAEALDADSAWLTPQQVAQAEKSSPLPEGDPGIDVTRQYYLRVVSARDGSSAAKAGLRTGDYIRAIDGNPTRDMSTFEGLRLLRGPVGSTVKLTVLRGSAAEPHEISVTREKLPVSQVTGRMVNGNVGVVRVAAFGNATAGELRKVTADLQKQGAQQLVLDLRATSTGTPADGIEAARLFVPGGTIVQREQRGQDAFAIAARSGDGSVTLPMTVLTTNGTAGAAEILVAAVSGNDRAQLVGERTLGRAAEQRLVRLPDGSGLWMTATRFLTPAGKPIHGHGIEPHVTVEEPEVEFGTEPPATDPILDKALETLAAKKAA